MICLFSVALLVLLLLVDVVLAPMLAELLIDPHQRNWCGMFSPCVSGIPGSFLDYAYSGAPWRKLDIAVIEDRAAQAVAMGALLGIIFSGLTFFNFRK